MRHVIKLFILILLSGSAKSQDNTSFYANFGFGFSLTPITVHDIVNSSGVTTIIGGGAVYVNPKYSLVKDYLLRYNFQALGKFHFPIIKNKSSWSLGIDFTIGAGFYMGLFGDDGINSFALSGTVSSTTEIDGFLSGNRILLGYRYNFCAIPYSFPIVGIDFDYLNVYCSLLPQRYFRYFSNGTLEPAIKIREIGINFFF